MIQLENVHKSYGQTKVLKGIDLQIQDQDDVVILGPSGSGKSTLLNVLSGLEKVDEAVSYTHLDVYKRQTHKSSMKRVFIG